MLTKLKLFLKSVTGYESQKSEDSGYRTDLQRKTPYRRISMHQPIEPVELSLEQQFNIQSFKAQAQTLNETQAKELLVDLYQQMIQRDNVYKELLKKQWCVWE